MEAVNEGSLFGPMTGREKELHRAIKLLWSDKRLRRRVRIISWSQIPLGPGLVAACWLALMLHRWHGWRLGLLLCGIVFGRMAVGGLFHDANHNSTFLPFGHSKRYDKLFGWLAGEVIYGFCSWWWAIKHTHHHVETNIQDHDGDLQLEPPLRLHPASKYWRRFNRYQHWYAWLLYPLMGFAMQYKGHKAAWFGGTHGDFIIRPARGWALFGSIIGLPLFYGSSFVWPYLVYGWTGVVVSVALYCCVAFIYGMAFQLAHCVDNVEFPTEGDMRRNGKKERLVHQLETTADFAPNNWVLSYFVSGLTHQTEHHVDWKYPFAFYWYMRPVVAAWCARHDVAFRTNWTFRSALKAHWSLLREMGRQERPFELEMG